MDTATSRPLALQLESIEPAIAIIKASLERAKSALEQEIRSYPAPIAGCDVQYKHLLEQRRKIYRELVELSAVSRTYAEPAQVGEALNRLIESSAYIDAEAKRALRERVEP